MNTALTIAVIFAMMYFTDASYIFSNIVGYGAGFINSFILNRRYTFASKGSVAKESLFYTAVYAVTYAIQFISLIFLRENLGFSENIATLLAIPFFTIPNFIGNRYVTFKVR